MKNSLLANSGILTEMFINMHCPCNKYSNERPFPPYYASGSVIGGTVMKLLK